MSEIVEETIKGRTTQEWLDWLEGPTAICIAKVNSEALKAVGADHAREP